MKPIQFVVFVAAFLLISCEKEETIVPTHQYNERTSSDLPLGPVSAIVIQNSLGPVIIDGGSDTSGVRWFLDKGILAEPPSAASQVCSQILVGLETINDTAYVSVHAPSTTASYSSLLSLTLPDNIPCVLRKISGTRDVSYLRSSFVGENVGASTILGRQGNCTVRARTAMRRWKSPFRMADCVWSVSRRETSL